MDSTATLSAESVVDLPVADTFGLFGSGRAEAWLFDARCERVAAGNVVSMRLPIDGDDRRSGRHGVELLGRISAVRPNSRIVVEHDQPWRGRIRLAFDADGAHRTRVRVRADVTASGIDWLIRRGGVALPDPAPTDALRIGLLTTKSGPGAVYASATQYLAELAVAEVEALGGVGGRRLELLVADDATDPALAAAEGARLVRAGCRAIFACTTSSSFDALRHAVRGDDVLLVHSVINEGGAVHSASVVRFGERPGAQVAALARPLMRAAGGRRWFLVGQRYSWSFGAHHAARRVLGGAGGSVVGEECVPLGTTDFAGVVDRVAASGADIVMSSLVGADEVAFQRQCAAAGLRSSTKALSLVMDESTWEHVGATAAEGVVTALGYFQDDPAAGNADLLRRYRDRFGPWAPPISSLSETVYEAVLRYARAVRHDPDADAAQQGRALVRPDGSGSAIGERDLLGRHLYLAEAGPDGLRVVDEAG
ncbi:MAG: branched-chain amino acid ABC transporter [Pseudonocardia sp. SCN 72-86]|nr:MAG: branched-chain amino acid ABC transporter [Pseudonocardia sp. SCN 72-86]